MAHDIKIIKKIRTIQIIRKILVSSLEFEEVRGLPRRGVSWNVEGGIKTKAPTNFKLFMMTCTLQNMSQRKGHISATISGSYK